MIRSRMRALIGLMIRLLGDMRSSNRQIDTLVTVKVKKVNIHSP